MASLRHLLGHPWALASSGLPWVPPGGPEEALEAPGALRNVKTLVFYVVLGPPGSESDGLAKVLGTKT